jgi:hypothetical protein
MAKIVSKNASPTIGAAVVETPQQQTGQEAPFAHLPAMEIAPERKIDLALEPRGLMTRQERAFFHTLRAAIKGTYFIFPQIPVSRLANLVQGKRLTLEGYSLFKSGVVDFVLANPQDLGAMLVVELNDESHRQMDARARDQKKEATLRQLGIPLLCIGDRENWDATQIRQRIDEKVLLGHSHEFLSARECSFFHTLRAAARDDYVIFPQVPLNMVLSRKRGKILPLEYYKVLQSSIVDFVLAHPKYLGPIVAIELGDLASYSQEREDLFRQAKFPFLRLYEGEEVDTIELRQRIEAAIRLSEVKT